MKVLNCIQGSPEWWSAREGIPTCSNFHRIITPKTQQLAGGAEDYIHELIGQKICHTPPFFTENPMNAAMRHGIDTEPHARRFYEMDRNATVSQVGFLLSDCGRYGGSPDGLVGDDGGLELKCPAIKTHVRYLLEKKLPDEYAAQVHGLLLVSGRPWWDFMSYAGPGVEPFLIRVEPGPFTRSLRVVLEQFLERYEKVSASLTGGKT